MVTITYNGQIIPNVYDKLEFNESYTEAYFSCKFLVTADTEDNLVVSCNAIEQALSIWNRDFIARWGDNNVTDYSFSHVLNTGYLARPEIRKLSDDLSTGTSRPYVFSVNFQLPARQAGYDYRQSANISLKTNYQQRKILSISGVYTAGGPNSAHENFENNGRDWADSIAVSILGAVNFEKLDENISYEQENKVLNFSIQYQEKLTVTAEYNGYTIPGGYYNFQHTVSYTNASVSLDFAIEKTEEDDILSFLTEKDAKLEITVGSKIYTYDPSDNSGFLVVPRIRKIDNLEEDNTKVFYNFSADLQLPARISTDFYRQSGTFTITYTASRRRRVDFDCVYTASDGSTAIQNYTDGVNGAKSWAISVLASLGFIVTGSSKNIELISESINEEHREKVANGKLSYQEILSQESGSDTDYSAIVDANLQYSVELMQDIGEQISSGFVQIPVHSVSISYQCKIDNDQVLSLEDEINAVYRDVIRPYIIEKAISVTGLSDSEFLSSVGDRYYMQSEKYVIMPSIFSVSGEMTIRIPKNITNHVLSMDEKLSTSRETGKNFIKIWDGKPNTYAIWGIGERIVKTRVVTVTSLGVEPQKPPALPGEFGGFYELKSESEDSVRRRFGVGYTTGNTPNLQSAISYTKTWREEYVLVIPAQI